MMDKNQNMESGLNLPKLMEEAISKLMIVRGQCVLLDKDVAILYGVETKRVNEAVRNNIEKFPEGYVFDLSDEESEVLRSKISTLKLSGGRGHHSKYN